MWAVTWTSTWPAPLSTQRLCLASRAGWLVTRWLSTLPNLNSSRTTLPLDTRLVTSNFIPACESLQHSTKFRGFVVFVFSPQFLNCLVLYFSNDGTEFGGSIYQKVNSNLETAVNLAWTAGSNNTRFGLGAKYQLDKDASLSVRTDKTSCTRLTYINK